MIEDYLHVSILFVVTWLCASRLDDKAEQHGPASSMHNARQLLGASCAWVRANNKHFDCSICVKHSACINIYCQDTKQSYLQRNRHASIFVDVFLPAQGHMQKTVCKSSASIS